MDFKEEAMERFGVHLHLSGGDGPKESPFILAPCTALEATHTQLETIRLINNTSGYIYRIQEVEAEPEGRIQAVAFERALVTDPLNKKSVACYFDWSAVEGEPHANRPLYVWSDPRSPIKLPHELGWVHYTRMEDFGGEGGPLDQACFYNAPSTKVTIYVYEHAMRYTTAENRAAAQATEMESVLASILAKREEFKPVNDPITTGLFDLRILASETETTMAAVACPGRFFVKARITFDNDHTMFMRMGETVFILGKLLDSQLLNAAND